LFYIVDFLIHERAFTEAAANYRFWPRAAVGLGAIGWKRPEAVIRADKRERRLRDYKADI
jgi:hypothetical protein